MSQPAAAAVDDLDASVVVFRAREGHDARACREAEHFLRSYHEYTPPADLMPIDEYTERVDIARRVRNAARSSMPLFEFTMALFSAIMLAPLHYARCLLSIPVDHVESFGGRIRGIGDNMKQLLRAFFHGPGATVPLSQSRRRRRAHGSSSAGSISPSPSIRSSGSARNSAQREKAMRRDGNVCIITGASRPHICHIIPFSWTESERNCATIQYYFANLGRMLWTADMLPPALFDELWGSLGAADKSWNMLALNPPLHDWWGRAYFGLKCLGELPAEDSYTGRVVPVKLQFRWLRRRAPPLFRPSAAINLDDQDDYENCFMSALNYAHNDEDISDPIHFKTGRLVRSGHVFTVRVPERDVTKFMAVINIQWALAQLGAMCAFAEATDDDNDDDDDDALVEAWVDDLAEGVGSLD